MPGQQDLGDSTLDPLRALHHQIGSGNMMGKIILVTGASSGLGALVARALAEAGHTVYAAISRDADRKHAAEMEDYARKHSLSLRAVGLEVNDQRSVDAAVAEISDEAGRIDVVIHTQGRMALGPAEAFTPYQLSQLYDENVLATQRVNRAVLPEMRERRDGLLVWVGSAVPDGAMPYLATFFGARAAAHHLASSYAVELARFGIETSIVTAGAQVIGHASLIYPDDAETTAAYEDLRPGLLSQAGSTLRRLTPAATSAARAVVTLVDTPKGSRPFSVTAKPPRSRPEAARTATAPPSHNSRDFYRYLGFDDPLSPEDEE
jgi:NAD(P)-dependent dehydrogenase (short-subunit alcohol dehydrogenase family)